MCSFFINCAVLSTMWEGCATTAPPPKVHAAMVPMVVRRTASTVLSSCSTSTWPSPRPGIFSRAMATHKALAMPDTRSLQVFQDQVLRGMWPDRHLRALSNNPETVGQLVGLLQCTKDLMEQTQNDPSAKSRRQSSRNILCLCHTVCQEDTLEWARCARKAASEPRLFCRKPCSRARNRRAPLTRAPLRRTRRGDQGGAGT